MIRKVVHSSGEFGRSGGDRVLYIAIDTENLAASKRAYESGKIDTITEKEAANCLANVAAGYWKFMDEESPVFPVYYTCVGGFRDGTAFITAHSNGRTTLTSKSNSVCQHCISKGTLDQWVKEGAYKIISEKEALALLDKPDRYFVSKDGFAHDEVAAILSQNGTKLSLVAKNGEVVPYNAWEKSCIQMIVDGSIKSYWDEITKSQYEEIVKKAKTPPPPPKLRDVKETVTNFVDSVSGNKYKVTVTTVIEQV